MKVPLPSILTTAWQASQPWPVTVTRPPLHYQPLDQLAVIRRHEDNPNDCVLPLSPLDLFSDLRRESVVAETDSFPFLNVAMGLLYLSRLGFADEGQALVTPLSWPDETHFGHGRATPGTEAEVVATYAHALVHRWEGSHRGERNLSGYANAHFWARAAMAKAKTSPELHERIRHELQRLLQFPDADGSSIVMELSPKAMDAGRRWFREWILEDLPDRGWEPRALTELCQTLEGKRPGTTDPISEFGAAANQLECDVLIRYCLERAGYQVPLARRGSDGKADHHDDLLRAAAKVSSAHVGSFQQNGVAVLRNVLPAKGEHAGVFARAVACRLLAAPACAMAGRSADSPWRVCLYYTDGQKKILGFDLRRGDVLVVSSCMAATTNADWKQVLVPCQTDHESVVYKDSLFGTRGETPTTVIQWSKGTIF